MVCVQVSTYSSQQLRQTLHSVPNSRYRHRNSNFLSKGSTFFSCGLRVEKKKKNNKKEKKNYRDLARKKFSSTSWIVKLIESAVHERFFHADGSVLFFISAKYERLKKWNCTHLYTFLFTNPVVCFF